MLPPRPSTVLPSRLRVLALALVAAAAVVPACNAVLDNRVGVLVADGGTSANDAETPADEAPAEEDTPGPDGAGSSSSSGSSGTGPRDADAGAAIVDAGAGDADAGPVCPAACVLPHATSTCVAGTCAVLACDVGFADCDAISANGCEADLSLPATCGACDVVCPVVPQAVSSCVAGGCRLTCVVGRADCNAEPADGCEADLAKDKRNCGACGVRCLIGKCRDGVCAL